LLICGDWQTACRGILETRAGSSTSAPSFTGATSGIGLETARQFLNEGARVAITGNLPTLETMRQELGCDVLVIAFDGAGQKKVTETLRRAFGGIDILFVNAGALTIRAPRLRNMRRQVIWVHPGSPSDCA
jgi:NADP-dependent 3-hydroxy acid dehydrogenase YdfG